MIRFNLQLFGGRGASYNPPSGGGNQNFSNNSLGTNVAETLKEAIGTKGPEIGMESAYKNANPNYDSSPMPYAEYTENCQRCVVAYELRRRGYNVTAQPTYEGDTIPQVANIDKSGAKWGRWQGAFRNANPISVNGRDSDTVYGNIVTKMKGFGSGARGVVSITYKGQRFGHVFNIENRRGVILAVDAQTGERIRLREFLKITDNSRTTLVRTDNLRISNRAKNFVTTQYAKR